MIGIEVQHFLSRARDFLKGMEGLVREDIYLLNDEIAQFRHSPALLGVHSAISYCDALRTGMGRIILSSDDHGKAAGDLESLLQSQSSENRNGIGHLKKLLGMKSSVAYGREALRENEIEEIVKHAERFAKWAEAAGRIQRIEGW
jgi:hypothetical protein